MIASSPATRALVLHPDPLVQARVVSALRARVSGLVVDTRDAGHAYDVCFVSPREAPERLLTRPSRPRLLVAFAENERPRLLKALVNAGCEHLVGAPGREAETLAALADAFLQRRRAETGGLIGALVAIESLLSRWNAREGRVELRP